MTDWVRVTLIENFGWTDKPDHMFGFKTVLQYANSFAERVPEKNLH